MCENEYIILIIMTFHNIHQINRCRVEATRVDCPAIHVAIETTSTVRKNIRREQVR